METLLFEIGTEEMPAKYMPGILEGLKSLAETKLKELRIPHGTIVTYGTPRRMALIVKSVPETQEDITTEAKGPSVKIAYGADGAPTKAAQGFARGQKVDVATLTVRDGYVYATKHITGAPVVGLLPAMLDSIIHGLSFPKNMRWGDHDFRFIRPIRWLVALYGSEVIPVEICGVTSGKVTRGHRFLSSGWIEIPTADDYVSTLEKEYVIVDQTKRRNLIYKQIFKLGLKEGGMTEIQEDLLTEVTYLVEYPTALCGHFEEKYLALPKEAVITPMREHQRYFPVLTEDGDLLPKFITVRNGGAEHLDVVTHGNERVLRARLSDAEFFFNEDRKMSLADRREKLKTVSFQEGLGTLYDKSVRLVDVSRAIADILCRSVDREKLARCAALAKADLVTGLVTEFTELQGVMGREYARLDGEEEEVALGIYEHYLPRFAGDVLPDTEIGSLVGLADKLDNIVATFSRGQAPTGSQDPFALRRQALGIINILLTNRYHLPLVKALTEVATALGLGDAKAAEILPQIMEFFRQRMRIYLIEEKHLRYDAVDAVMNSRANDDMLDIYQRVTTVDGYVNSDVAAETIQAFTRVQNIVKKQQVELPVTEALFTHSCEGDLYRKVVAMQPLLIQALTRYDYAKVLIQSGRLTSLVNNFFDGVMVMDENEDIRNNRLSLLNLVHDIATMVGDLSYIVM